MVLVTRLHGTWARNWELISSTVNVKHEVNRQWAKFINSQRALPSRLCITSVLSTAPTPWKSKTDAHNCSLTSNVCCGRKTPVFEQTLQPLPPPPPPLSPPILLSSLPLIIMVVMIMMMIMIINKRRIQWLEGKIDQWLRYHTAFVEDENLVSRSMLGWSQMAELQTSVAFETSNFHRHQHSSTHTHTQTYTQIYIIKHKKW